MNRLTVRWFYNMKKLFSLCCIPLFFILFYLFQNGFFSWLVFIVFLPLFFSIDKKKYYIKSKSILVFVCGFVFYSYNYLWISNFNFYSVIVIGVIYSLMRFTIPYIIISLVYKKNSIYYSLFVASVFTFFEYFSSLFPFPFPYGVSSLGLFTINILLQILDIVGQFGLTFLIYLINFLLYILVRSLISSDWKSSLSSGILFFVLSLFWISYGYLSFYMLKFEKKIYIDLAQSNLQSSEKVKMNYFEYKDSINSFIDRKNPKSDIIIFPETFFYTSIDKEDNIVREYLNRMSVENEVAIAGGFIENTNDPPFFKYNSFMTMQNGVTNNVSRKSVLAPFGEYYPLGRFFSELKNDLVNRQGAFFFNRGKEVEMHLYNNNTNENIRFIPLICFEASFGSLLKGVTPQNTDFLLTVSSDLWTNSCKGMMQNSIFSKFRAIEYRLPLVRVSNGGLSGYISSSGKTWLPLPAFTEGNAHIELVKSSHKIYKNGTPFAFFGDFFVLLSLVYFLTYLIFYFKKSHSMD